MDSVPPPPPPGTAGNEAYSTVDPFLIEAVQNPRHRLTILRMELDIQKFLQNSDQQQFEFQHFPTSYLRLAAHRVAQHYGLQTMVQDNVSDGLGNRIVVKKLAESRYPAVCLSDVLAKQSENDKHDQVKIVMRPRCNKASNEASEIGAKRSPMRTVEERKEQYDRARARIFSSPSSPESEDSTSHTPLDGKIMCLNGDENEGCKNSMIDLEKLPSLRDAGTSSYRVAIFRDREKDRTDPDYDRSYERYVKTSPASQSFVSAHYNMQKFQPPFVQYDNGFPQLGQVLRTQASVGYRTPIMNPFCATGFNQTSRDAVYMQWPTSTMMYAESYDQFRRAVFQVPYSQQQPLSFDYSQNR